MYLVKRHGGNSNYAWRIIYHTLDQASAWARYEKAARDMRQGSVVLVNVTENAEIVIAENRAPMVRTRW